VPSHHDILVGSRAWSATPWDYSSLVYLQFVSDAAGQLVYGYGQTIYARLNIRFELPVAGQLRVHYLDSPKFQRFAGYSPPPASARKALRYSPVEQERAVIDNITGLGFTFRWLLTLDQSPFPDTLTFPHETPLEYFGYRESVGQQ
jgi:hypothetical protein